jgi:hypothetical protein
MRVVHGRTRAVLFTLLTLASLPLRPRAIAAFA